MLEMLTMEKGVIRLDGPRLLVLDCETEYALLDEDRKVGSN